MITKIGNNLLKYDNNDKFPDYFNASRASDKQRKALIKKFNLPDDAQITICRPSPEDFCRIFGIKRVQE